MTSSTDAIVHGHPEPGRVHTEADWSEPARLAPYPKSKIQAERVAWDFAATHPAEPVTINPKQELGWVPRPASESIVAAGESMIRYNIV